MLGRLALFEVILLSLLLGSAGRMDLPWFWGLMAIHAAYMFVCYACMDPGLREERVKGRPAGWDRYFRTALALGLLAHLLVAGLDVRYGWSSNIPTLARAAGLLLYTAGTGLAVSAMCFNRFFAPAVRIQSERGHHVVTDGPYRLVRHPGYLGLTVALAAESLVFGSYYALIPVVVSAVVLVVRTTIEDRMLREELPGYAEYALRVRSRLVPGVW